MKDTTPTSLVSAVLIVRDEQECISNCLKSLCNVVDEIIVVDTGSIDNTLKILSNSPAKIYHFKWNNSFADARNFGIQHASHPFILTIDADETLLITDSTQGLLHKFTGSYLPNTVGTVTLINLTGNDLKTKLSTHTLSRLFNKCDFTYRGLIHEQLEPINNGRYTTSHTGLTIHHTGYSQTSPNIEKKWQRNEEQLLHAVKKESADEYLQYQLGKTYFVQKKFKSAISSLSKCIDLINWESSPPLGSKGSVTNEILVDLICTLAYSYINNDQLDTALKVLETHNTMHHGAKKYSDFPHALGYTYLMIGNIEKSRFYYESSIGLGDSMEQVAGTGSYSSYFHLGLLSEAEQKQEIALSFYHKALQLNPDYAPALSRLKVLREGGL